MIYPESFARAFESDASEDRRTSKDFRRIRKTGGGQGIENSQKTAANFQPPYKFISELIAILRDRRGIWMNETHIEFVTLRKEAKERATIAKIMLEAISKPLPRRRNCTLNQNGRGNWRRILSVGYIPPIHKVAKLTIKARGEYTGLLDLERYVSKTS